MIISNMDPIWDAYKQQARAAADWSPKDGVATDPANELDLPSLMPFLDPLNYADRSFLPTPNLVLPLQYPITIKTGVPLLVDLGCYAHPPEGCYYELQLRQEIAAQYGVSIRGGVHVVNPTHREGDGNWRVTLMYDGAGMNQQTIVLDENNLQWQGSHEHDPGFVRMGRGTTLFMAVVNPIVSTEPTKPIAIPLPTQIDPK